MVIILIAILVTRDRKLQILLCFRTATVEPTEEMEMQELQGHFELYGNLSIPPDRQPTRVALDIMTRMFLSTGLPANTLILPCFPLKAYLAGSIMENGIVAQGFPRAAEQSIAIPSSHYETSLIGGGLPKSVSEVSRDYVAFPKSVDPGGRQLQSVERKDAIDLGQWVEGAYESENEIFVVGVDEEVLGGDKELIIDPVSFGFGSGKAIAGPYR